MIERRPGRAGWRELVVGMMLAGCGEASLPPTSPATTERSPGERLVSLSPAITRTVIDLGAGDRLVGRTPFCRGTDPAVPAVGSLLEIDPEAMLARDPDVVLVQPTASGVDPGLRRLADREGWRIETFRIDSIRDLEAMLERLPEAIATGDSRRDELVAAQSSRLRSELHAASVALPEEVRARVGRTLILFGVDPPMAFGRGSFPDRLIARLGVANAVESEGYPQLSVEDLRELDPDTVVLLRDAPEEGDDPLDRLRRLGFARTGPRIVVVRHPEALTPGSGWIEAAAELRGVLESLGGESP